METKKNKPSKEALQAVKNHLETNNMDLQQEISLCLSDMRKDHMTRGRNGKIYISLTVAMRKELDQWGRDLKVYETPTSDDRNKNLPKNYVGGGKSIIFVHDAAESPSDEELNNIIPPIEPNEKEDLPF